MPTAATLCSSCRRRARRLRRHLRPRPDHCGGRDRALLVRGRPSAPALFLSASARQVERIPFGREIARGLLTAAGITAWGSVLLLLGG